MILLPKGSQLLQPMLSANARFRHCLSLKLLKVLLYTVLRAFLGFFTRHDYYVLLLLLLVNEKPLLLLRCSSALFSKALTAAAAVEMLALNILLTWS